MRPRMLRDFNTIDEIVAHARTQDGATHAIVAGPATKIYYPMPGGEYEESTIWQKGGYWHTQAAGSRSFVRRLPRDARPIGWQRRPTALPLQERAIRYQRTGAATTLASTLSRRMHGERVRPVPGGLPWNQSNETAQFVTYSPNFDQKVVVTVSVFPDNSVALRYFSDEGLKSAYDIAQKGYRGDDVRGMANDIFRAWLIIDGQAEGWQAVGEKKRRPGVRKAKR